MIKMMKIDFVRAGCYNPPGVSGDFILNNVIGNSKHNTRDVILRAIKEANQATVEELARVADVSPVTVRHHLNVLQADGLLVADTVRRKVGRPYYVYGLSDKGQELFPQKYMRLSSRLLDELKENFPAGTVSELFLGVVRRIVEERRNGFQNSSIEGRLAFLVELLAEEGFLARWEKLPDGRYRVTEFSCPYLSVGQKHAEICTFDKALIHSVLETEVMQHSCMLEGNSCCDFTFTPVTDIAVR
jgi:predicted ArsR family transcriptional regulator